MSPTLSARARRAIKVDLGPVHHHDVHNPVAPLVSVAEVAEVIARTEPSNDLAELAARTDPSKAPADRDPPVLLDVRWAAGRVDRDGYLAGHLPGAQFLDLDADLAAPPGLGGRHPLPEPERLQVVWRRVGINRDSEVIVYDGNDSSVAARAWWLLRWSGLTDIRVLDGGLAAWMRAGLPLEHGELALPARGTVTVRPGGLPSVSAEQAAELAADDNGDGGVLLDARAAARYRGEVEPLDPVAGHIPGAVNLPFAELLTEAGTFRPPAELRTALDRVGASGVAGAAASCGSGVTACHLILAGEIVGVPIALYAGSYSGWLALGRPVATGSAPAGSLT